MSNASPDLPAPPLRFHRFAWRGIPLILPDDWNLRLHGGTDREGALLFSDLRVTRLELRWRTPTLIGRWKKRDPLPLLEKTLARLAKRHPAGKTSRLSANAAQFELPEKLFILIAAGDRLFELHCPESPNPQIMHTITADFLDSIPRANQAPDKFWSVYGATGSIPPTARLKKISLLPGATTLSFAGKKTAITLGAVSLADRLLADGRTLRQWAAAAIPLIARHPAGQWHESPNQATFTAQTRNRFRPAYHLLTLHHDPAANRICWTHHLNPPAR